MIKSFLNGKYEALAFSYDFPEFLIENYDEMEKENTIVTDILNDNMPEICSEYEIGQPFDEFKQKTKVEYDKAKEYA